MSHDTLVHRVIRPTVRAIAGTAITPDHLTALRLATGLGAAASFAGGGGGGQGWLGLGTCLFVLSALLDRADGELARQTRRFSRHGHRCDLVADCACTAAVFVGLGVGAAGGALGRGSVALGALAGAGVVALFWQINVAGRGELPRYTGSDGRVLGDPDDALFAVPLILWCAGAEAVLALAGVLAPAAALWVSTRPAAATPAPRGRPVPRPAIARQPSPQPAAETASAADRRQG